MQKGERGRLGNAKPWLKHWSDTQAAQFLVLPKTCKAAFADLGCICYIWIMQTICFSTKVGDICFLIQVEKRPGGHIQTAFCTCWYCYHGSFTDWSNSGLDSSLVRIYVTVKVHAPCRVVWIEPFFSDSPSVMQGQGHTSARLRRCSDSGEEDNMAAFIGKDVLFWNDIRGPSFRGGCHLQELSPNRISKS